jgi:hypothetical protein
MFLNFLKLGPNTRSTKQPKIGYFERKKRGTKIKKVQQKCQLLIFFNEILTSF